MTDVVYPEWRDGNARIKYPFADSASLSNSAGAGIALDLFDDARLYLIGALAGVYLSKISITADQVTFYVADSTGTLASGSFLFTAAPEQVTLFDNYGRSAGVLVSTSSKLSALNSVYGLGDVLFEADQTEFAASVVILLPNAGIRGVLLDDGNMLSGDVYLVGTDGIVVREENGTVRVDIIGDPYAFLRACQAEGFDIANFCGLKTINGISPNKMGDFKLTIGGNLAADNLLRIEQPTNGAVNIRALGLAGI